MAKNKVPVNTILNNPGNGVSKIISYNGSKLCYQRGKSKFYISLEEFFQAYRAFDGQFVATNNLKKYKPEVFDSSNHGHNCNSTLFFMFLKEMELVEKISGKGVAGKPFGIQL